MSKSDARFEYRQSLPRRDHDLSQPFGFTTAPGMLNPIFMDYATPGDSYYIKHDLRFMRTSPLVAPAMIDVKVHYETFFVPMQMLYQPFENTLFPIKPILSSMFDPASLMGTQLPYINYADLYSTWHEAYSSDKTGFAEFVRLLDFFDINRQLLNVDPDTYTGTITGFPMFPLAYQCIYQHYYRLDDKEEFTNNTYNVDRYYNDNIPYDSHGMFTLRYRPWHFDYFTSSYRSPILSSVNTLSMPRAAVLSPLSTAEIQPINALGQTFANDGGNYNDLTTNFSPHNNASFQQINQNLVSSTAAIRQMFAQEKLAMITGRTRKNYDSQVLAHYGFNVPHDVKHDISLIGHDEFDLQIGEVTSLASTEAAPLGEIAGKGWAAGYGKEQYKFVAPCHGVIMTIFSVEPIKRYYGTTNRLNVISSSIDLPTPEYDRLGNMPIFTYEAGVPNDQTSYNPFAIAAWKERYYFSKRRSPRVSMAFMHRADSAQPTYDLNTYSSYFISSEGFSLPNWVDNKIRPNDLSSYLISPNSLDALMLMPFVSDWQENEEGENWNVNPYLQFQRDPLIVDSWIKCKKVSWMSVDGEPIYD